MPDKALQAGQRSAPFCVDETAVLVHASGPQQVAFNTGEQKVMASLGAWDSLSLPAGCCRL